MWFKIIHMSYERVSIVKGSMGCYLDAPNYPTYFFEVRTDLNRAPQNQGGMNLVYALECSTISPEVKARINKLIADWDQTKPAVGSAEFNTWVNECIAHFGLSRYIKHVQKFYPDFNK